MTVSTVYIKFLSFTSICKLPLDYNIQYALKQGIISFSENSPRLQIWSSLELAYSGIYYPLSILTLVDVIKLP